MKSLHSAVLAMILLLASGFLYRLACAAAPAAAARPTAESAEAHKSFRAWIAPIFAEEVKWTDVAQLGVAIIGFVLILSQLGKLKKQLAGDAYTSLYEQYVDVCKLFLEKPHLRPYFYEKRAVDATIPDRKTIQAEVEIVAELMTGLLEHAAVQQDSIPKDIYEQCWLEFTKDRFESPALISYWQENKRWYAGGFQIMVENILAGRETKAKSWRKLARIFKRVRKREKAPPTRRLKSR